MKFQSCILTRCLSNRDANDEFCPRYRVPAFAIPLVVRYLIRTLVQIDRQKTPDMVAASNVAFLKV